MITISSSDVVKKPSYITNPQDITFVEDAKKHIKKSVVLPYALYEKLKEQIEYEIWLQKNKKGLIACSNENDGLFDDVIEELGDKVKWQ